MHTGIKRNIYLSGASTMFDAEFHSKEYESYRTNLDHLIESGIISLLEYRIESGGSICRVRFNEPMTKSENEKLILGMPSCAISYESLAKVVQDSIESENIISKSGENKMKLFNANSESQLFDFKLDFEGWVDATAIT